MSRKNNGNKTGNSQDSDADDAVVVVMAAGTGGAVPLELGEGDDIRDLIGESVDDEEQSGKTDEPSKSQLKREADAIRVLGQKLAELAPRERAAMPLDDDIITAIDNLNAIRKHGARKRQLGFLAKRLRRIDLSPIVAAMEKLQHEARASGARHHRIESWRDRLLGDTPDESAAEALTACLDEFPGADRQRLRQLQRRALDERARQKPPTAARELFRLVRDAASEAESEPADPDALDAEDASAEPGSAGIESAKP